MRTRPNVPIRKKKENEHNINEDITAPEVRITGDNIEPKIVPTSEALSLARSLGLDLVETVPNAAPPVCKIIEYNKYLYQKKKDEKDRKKNSNQVETKELRFSPDTDQHDIEFKLKHANKFLADGNKVKCTVLFKGRSIMYAERGELLLLEFADKLSDISKLESLPKLEGKKMNILLLPKKK